MKRDHVGYLISETYQPDALNQMIPVESLREVMITIGSVRQSEWFNAGQRGLKPQMVAEVFSGDYADETLIQIDGVRYTIYRTFLGENDQMELYLEKKGGS